MKITDILDITTEKIRTTTVKHKKKKDNQIDRSLNSHNH